MCEERERETCMKGEREKQKEKARDGQKESSEKCKSVAVAIFC